MTAKCILQVEDNESDIILLKHVFARAGIESPVHAVRDGREAIDYLKGVGQYQDREKHPLPCLMLLDLKMPRVDGFEVLKWVRSNPKFSKLVVVMFTSSAMPWDIERAYELGANSYIEKPSSVEKAIPMAQMLKGWWLGYNHFAPIGDRVPPKDTPEFAANYI